MPLFRRLQKFSSPFVCTAPIHVLDRMVNNLMGIFASQSAVRGKGISVERRASFNMLFNFCLQGCAFPVRHNCCADVAPALQQYP